MTAFDAQTKLHAGNTDYGDADHGHAHEHPPHLAHHFDTPEQQFGSAKIGMWAFLATEILMFGGLFCAYAVMRYNNPDVFAYNEHHLNTWLGATNTVVLLASSLTMALAVRAAQLGQQKYLKLMLSFTLLGGVGFLCIKAVEYSEKFGHGLVPGVYNEYSKETTDGYSGLFAGFTHHDGEDEGDRGQTGMGAEEEGKGSGDDNHGAPGNDELDREHEEGSADAEEAMSLDPSVEDMAKMNRPEPDVPAPGDPATEEGDGEVAAAGERTEGTERAIAAPADEIVQFGDKLLYMGKAYSDPNYGGADAIKIRPGYMTEPATAGVAAAHHDAHGVEYTDLSIKEQTNVWAFFSIYYMMTGLHGLHVLVGMGLIGHVLIKSFSGMFGPGYYTPVDLVGLYWHLVDLIWIFLFPLLYLIH